jgi:hypothetical protein
VGVRSPEDQDRQIRRLGDLVQLVQHLEPSMWGMCTVEEDQVRVMHVRATSPGAVVGALDPRESRTRQDASRISMFASSSSTTRMRAFLKARDIMG